MFDLLTMFIFPFFGTIKSESYPPALTSEEEKYYIDLMEKEQEDYCFEFKLGTVFESERYILSFKKVNKKERSFLCFDGDKLPYNAIIRTKRTGDSIITFGGQRKSLKKFLTDKKRKKR